jgi:hypothetical protein
MSSVSVEQSANQALQGWSYASASARVGDEEGSVCAQICDRFLLLDSSLSIVSFNSEAVQILRYPDNVENVL